MSRERELLRRLVEWYDEMPGYGSIGVIASDARALLAEPAPEEEDETANVDWERVYHPELYATPPAASVERDVRGGDIEPEAVGRLRDFIREHSSGGCRWLSKGNECVCPLCDVDRLRHAAYRPLPRAEAEAMVEAYKDALLMYYDRDRTIMHAEPARAALLAALCGEGM